MGGEKESPAMGQIIHYANEGRESDTYMFGTH